MNWIKYGTVLFIFSISALFGWWGYQYIFDTSVPRFSLSGILEGNHYGGDVACTISGDHDYKVSTLSISLDDTPLINKYYVSRKRFEHPFTIPTRTLPQGKHVLKITAKSGTYAGKELEQRYEFVVDNLPLQAAFVKSDTEHKVFQGRTLHIQFQTNKELQDAKVTVLSDSFDAYPEAKNAYVYEAYVPISCEEKPNEYLFTVDITDKVGNSAHLENKFQVVLFPFKKQTLRVEADKMKKEHDIGRPQEELEAELEELVKFSPKEKLWTGMFYAPIEIAAVSTEYGTTRITQEKGKYMHKAVDVVNTPKCVVWASQRGKVIIKDRFVFSGNTVVLDHGYGLFSMFYHLEDFADINIGDMIKRGARIGTLGKTGYASGYHLHWEMRINNIPVDPLQWIKPGF